jgi:hypothetical protein
MYSKEAMHFGSALTGRQNMIMDFVMALKLL